MLKDIRDGDQAYWCHTCERGWRAGHLPPEARRAKAKALLEESLEVMPIPEPEIVAAVKKPRQVSLTPEITQPKSKAKPVGAPLKPVLLEPEVSLKTKVTRVAKAKTTPEAVILETSPVIIPAPRKPRTPKAVVPVTPKAIVPVVLAQPEPVIPEVKKQKSRASLRTTRAGADHQVRFGFEKRWFQVSPKDSITWFPRSKHQLRRFQQLRRKYRH